MIRSLDGGDSWSESGISVNHDLTASDSNFGSMAVAGNGGTVLLMKDGVWMDISRPDILDGGVTDIALTGNNSFVVISGASIWTCIVYDGGGTDWDGRWGDSSAVLSSVSFLDTNNGLISGENGTILATNDGGQTWNYRDAPSDVSASEIVDVEYYSSIRAYAISNDGHILKSSKEGNVPVGFVWSIVDIEREYPPGGGDEFENGGSSLDFNVSKIEVLGQFKVMLSGPNGYLSLIHI